MGVSLNELKKALESLKEALELYQANKSVSVKMEKALRDACIQRFEYGIELSWKTSMKILGSTTVAAKPAIREMARSNLVTNPDLWLKFIDHRNNTSHAYDEDIAMAVFSVIEEFSKEADMLFNQLEKMK